MCETFDPVALKPNGPQDALGHSLSPLSVVSAVCVLRDFNLMSCLSAGADILANVSPGIISQCTPAVHLTTQHIPCFRGVTVCAFVSTHEGQRERCWSVCVFPDVSERVERSDGCWGQERLGGVRGWGTLVRLMGADWWLASIWKAFCSRSWVKGQTWDTCG